MIRTTESATTDLQSAPLAFGNFPIMELVNELNHQPADYKSAALPIELHQHAVTRGESNPVTAVKGRCLDRLTNGPTNFICLVGVTGF